MIACPKCHYVFPRKKKKKVAELSNPKLVMKTKALIAEGRQSVIGRA